MKRTWYCMLAASLVLAIGCGPKADPKAEEKPDAPVPETPVAVKETPASQLKIEVLEEGKGPDQKGDVVAKGDIVNVSYEGKLADGTVFDGNIGKPPTKPPFSFTVGNSEVIKGWDEGLLGAKLGSRIKLSVPYAMGYGERGSPPTIPAKSDLYFEVIVHDIVKEKDPQGYDRVDVKKGAGKAAALGDVVTVNYTGRFVNGMEFDSNKKRGPFPVTLGQGQVIPGWEVGLLGIQKGGIRTLRIPPALAYGAMGRGEQMPGNMVLNFEIECLNVAPASKG